MSKIQLKYPVVVEGKYDKIKLSSFVSSPIIVLNGFGLFKSDDIKALIKSLAETTPLIILTDSDSAGNVIRNAIKGFVNKESLINLYIPRIFGKEKRKISPSKEHLLGVEGTDTSVLINILQPYTISSPLSSPEIVTKAHLWADGFSGAENSNTKRKCLAAAFGLPEMLSANALIEAINLLGGLPAYKKKIEALVHD